MNKKMIMACVLVLGLVFFTAPAAMAAYTLSMEATTDGSTVATDWPQGGYLYLTVTMTKDTADDAPAGVAFTINYDSAILTAPVTTADGDPSIDGTIVDGYPFTFQTNNKTFKANSSETDKIYFSGADINEDVTPRGGPGNTADDVDMFTVRFQVNWAATPGSAIEVSLTQTELWNPPAGYGTNGGAEVTEDRPFDEAGGDVKETVPVLVGAVDENDAAFGGDLADDFPTLLDTLAGTPVIVGTVVENPNQPVEQGISFVYFGEGTGWSNSADVINSNPDYTGLAKWNPTTQGWDQHSSFVSVPLAAGDTFFLISSAGGEFPGGTLPASPSYTLSTGINFVMLPTSKAGVTSSADLLADITATGPGTCTGAGKWNGTTQGWDSHSSFVSFPIAVGEVCFVIVDQGMTWP